MTSETSRRAPSSRGFVWGEIGATIVLYQTLMTVFLVAPPIIAGAAGWSAGLREGTAISLGCTALAEAIALLLLVLWLRRDGWTLADLGWSQPTTARALAVAVLFGLVYAAFTLWSLGLGTQWTELSLFKFWGATVGLFGAVTEEIIFRGFLLTELERVKVGRIWQILVSGLTFSLIHMGFSLWGMLATLVMGVVLAAVYIWGRRSLTAPVVGHAVVNVLIEPWLLFWLITFYASR